MRLQPPPFQVRNPLLDRPSVVLISNVVNQAHVGIDRKHRRTLGLRQELESVVEVPRLRAGELFAIGSAGAQLTERGGRLADVELRFGCAHYADLRTNFAASEVASAAATSFPFCQFDITGLWVSVS